MQTRSQSRWLLAAAIPIIAGLALAMRQPTPLPEIDVQFITVDRTSGVEVKHEISRLLKNGYTMQPPIHTGVDPAGQLLTFSK